MNQDDKAKTKLGTRAAIAASALPPPSVQLPTVMAAGSIPPSSAQLATSSAQLPTVIVTEAGAAPPFDPDPAPPFDPDLAPPLGPPPGSHAGSYADFSLDGAFATRPHAPVGGDDPELFVGHELGGYVIKRKLAEGGMGVVFEGVHGKIGRRGAIKVLKLELCRAEDVVQRFHQEARAVNEIRHENIVDIYDFGRDPYGRVFFVMEFLEGEPLSARIRRGPLPWAEAFSILEQTLRALKAAHDKGFVHRDLKPDNIWLRYTDGRIEVKLLDFGIAKLVGSESPREKLTQTGSVMGTPHYMSPEQINGSRDVDHRTDIYAMGVIMYEMFAGTTPFIGDTLQAIMTGHLFKEVPRLAELPPNLGVPGPIAEIIDRMLVKDATGRYDSVADILDDLHDVNRHERPTNAGMIERVRPARPPAPAPAPAPVLAPAAAPGRKGARALLLTTLALAGLAVAALALWRMPQRAPDERPLDRTDPGPKDPSPPPPPPPLDYDWIRATSYKTVRAGLDRAELEVRQHSVLTCSKTKDPAAGPKLTRLTRGEGEPDPSVRQNAALALGASGASEATPLLRRLERAEAAPLKLWFAAALARLGDQGARKRLIRYAEGIRRKDLATAFWITLELADLSQPGDRRVIKLLEVLAAHEPRLRQLIDDYVGVRILTKLVALRHEPARKQLHALLESDHESVRLAAAEALAKLGDDAGKKVFEEVLANPASPNQLVAAVAQIALGEYGGLELLTQKLAAKDPEIRQLAMRGLGEIGEPASIAPLLAFLKDPSWLLRISAASALIAIVGIEPLMLAQASVDWTKNALDSRDWAVRKAAAGVLADIPEQEALPLLAAAIADPDERVRLAAATSAAGMKTAGAATAVVAAVKTEPNPKVKEQQIKALGEIGNPVAKETLAEIAREPGRLGVMAAGAGIAVGDPSGKDRLEAAVRPGQPTDLRLAAVEAATVARNPIVVPTLLTGVKDFVFDVRFTAALGLANMGAGKDAAVPVLTAALDSRDAGVIGRAMAALLKLGHQLADRAPSPEKMIASADPKQRLAAVPIVRALPVNEGVPLLRRLVRDPDGDVRRASVDAIEAVVPRDKEQAIRLYKPLVQHEDPVVRTKASARLSELVPAPPRPPPPPGPGPGPTGGLAPPPVDATLPAVRTARDEAAAAAAAAKPATEAFEALLVELAARTARQPRDEGALGDLGKLATSVDEAAVKLEAVALKAEDAAVSAADHAGGRPSPDAAKLITEARGHAKAARAAASAARHKVPDAEKQARRYIRAWTKDAQMLINTARTAMLGNNLAEAEESLDKAAKQLRRSGESSAELDHLYVDLFVAMSDHAQELADKRRHLQRAKVAFARLERSGAEQQVQDADAQLAELAEEIEQLGKLGLP
jgi:HEAT repeat protein